MHTLILGLAADDWWVLGFSILVSSCSVCLSLPFGLGLGYVLARKSFPCKALVETVVNLPLVLPPVVTGFVLLLLLGRRGWIGSWLLQSSACRSPLRRWPRCWRAR